MNSSKAVIIGVCVVLVLGFFMIRECSNSGTKKAIVSVLNYDNQLVRAVPSVEVYLKNMGRFDLSSCPSDFQKAFRNYQAAWREIAFVEQEIIRYKDDSTSLEALLESFVRGALGDLGKPLEVMREGKELQLHYDSAKKSIHDTFYIVLDVADSHGVNTSPYR